MFRFFPSITLSNYNIASFVISVHKKCSAFYWAVKSRIYVMLLWPQINNIAGTQKYVALWLSCHLYEKKMKKKMIEIWDLLIFSVNTRVPLHFALTSLCTYCTCNIHLGHPEFYSIHCNFCVLMFVTKSFLFLACDFNPFFCFLYVYRQAPS